jgi:hypothetical protein
MPDLNPDPPKLDDARKRLAEMSYRPQAYGFTIP